MTFCAPKVQRTNFFLQYCVAIFDVRVVSCDIVHILSIVFVLICVRNCLVGISSPFFTSYHSHFLSCNTIMFRLLYCKLVSLIKASSKYVVVCIQTEEQVQELDLAAMKNMPAASNLTRYADSVVKWFVAFLSKIKRVVNVVKMQSGELQSQRGTAQSVDNLSGVSSSESQLSTVSENSRAASMYEDLLLGGDIILDVICSTRENVHIVHEVFRQVKRAVIIPCSHHGEYKS